MRLLFCTTDGEGAFNGINAWLLNFLPALAAAGHLPSTLIFSWSPAKTCHTYPRLRDLGIPCRVIYPMHYTEAAVRCCVREATRAKPDIFVANHVLPALLALPSLAARGIPGISVLHNDDAEYQAKAAFPSDATIGISSGLTRLIPNDGRLKARIPYGVPPSTARATPPTPTRPLRLVYHGRIATHQKRILETAAALVRICRALPETEADLYGSGPDEDALRNALARDDASGRVRYLGPRSAEQLRELLPTYHVAVLLSDFEGLGLSVLEAMSAGLVPVCFRTESGLPDILIHESNGLFVTDRTTHFDAAITRLSTDPALWSHLSQGALATAHNEFSPSACIHAWEHVFRTLTTRPPRPRPRSFRNSLPPPAPALAPEDHRYPGFPRALWRWLRFGPTHARLPW